MSPAEPAATWQRTELSIGFRLSNVWPSPESGRPAMKCRTVSARKRARSREAASKLVATAFETVVGLLSIEGLRFRPDRDYLILDSPRNMVRKRYGVRQRVSMLHSPLGRPPSRQPAVTFVPELASRGCSMHPATTRRIVREMARGDSESRLTISWCRS